TLPGPEEQARHGMAPGSSFTFDSLHHSTQPASKTEINYQIKQEPSSPEDLATETPAADFNETSPVANEHAYDWETLTVRSGDNLSLIFDRLHISRQALDSIMSLGKPAMALKYLMPGHELRVRHSDGQLHALEYDINLTDTIHVSRQDTVFLADTVTTELETRVNQAFAIITDSLFLSAQRSGLSDNLTMQLVELFGWDIDFALDIREGDRFFILYEEKFKNGEKMQDGPILAAEFINQDTPFHSVRYKTADGYSSYYDEEGFSMRKAFLRTPVNFRRISSVFSQTRKHPILNKIRAHKGVDYAAPIGTPVKSTADGIVSYAGTNGGYGKEIVLRHGEKYSTAYGHLSRFANGITVGKRIQQGQTIGYVGMTGLATGPHLHYEFRINGVHHNPLTVVLPKALGISVGEMADFKAHTRSLMAQLETAKAAMTQQAAANDKSVVALIKDPAAIRAIE
ncbi:MAG TPA: peptidoglycan DD-metalloendopeptidase family protein, partial [Gammaproteobacteria bacterium]